MVGEKELDEVGRVIDFSVLKDKLCTWVEAQWDHKFLMWEKDPYLDPFKQRFADIGIRVVPFNPTAENIARYLVEVVGPEELPRRVRLVKVTVEETRKCSASYEVPA
jgi:6-pyruvoyltetrahydropterin/6-carboxytetrahydropterin synthase